MLFFEFLSNVDLARMDGMRTRGGCLKALMWHIIKFLDRI